MKKYGHEVLFEWLHNVISPTYLKVRAKLHISAVSRY